MAWTSDDLVAAVRLRAQLPDAASDGAFTDANIMSFMDEDVAMRIVPELRRAREGYGLAEQTIACDGSTTDFTIPDRAQSGTLHDVLLVDSAGDEVSIPMVPTADMWRFPAGNGPLRFALIGSVVRLLGDTPSSSYSIRMRYYLRPSRLTAVASCDVLASTAADTPSSGRTEITGTTVPSGWATGDKFDLVAGVPNFELVAMSAKSANMSPGASGTFDIPTSSLIGRFATLVSNGASSGFLGGSLYICPEDTTCVSPVPTEWVPYLVRCTVTSVLESKGDMRAADVSFRVGERLLSDLRSVINPRIDGEAKRIINRNSPLRYKRRSRGRY